MQASSAQCRLRALSATPAKTTSATFARVTQASLDQIVFCIQIQIVAYAIEYLKEGDYDTLGN